MKPAEMAIKLCPVENPELLRIIQFFSSGVTLNLRLSKYMIIQFTQSIYFTLLSKEFLCQSAVHVHTSFKN